MQALDVALILRPSTHFFCSVFLHDTPADDDGSQHTVWLQKVQQFRFVQKRPRQLDGHCDLPYFISEGTHTVSMSLGAISTVYLHNHNNTGPWETSSSEPNKKQSPDLSAVGHPSLVHTCYNLLLTLL